MADLEQDEIEQFKCEYKEAKSQVISVYLQLIDMVNTCEIKIYEMHLNACTIKLQFQKYISLYFFPSIYRDGIYPKVHQVTSMKLCRKLCLENI